MIKKKYIAIDIEADGPCPGLYSMIELGAIDCDTKEYTHIKLAPISGNYVQEALDVTGSTRAQTLDYVSTPLAMGLLQNWLKERSDESTKLIFLSDTAGFDWQFVNYYFHMFCKENPFGYDGKCITDLYQGSRMDVSHKIKEIVETRLTHNPVDDAMRIVEAYQYLKESGFVF